jgi:hypothetical protein
MNIPGSQMAGKVNIEKTEFIIILGTLFKLLTEKVVVGWLLLVLCGNILYQHVNIVQNINNCILSEIMKRHLSQRKNTNPCDYLRLRQSNLCCIRLFLYPLNR